MVRVILGLAAVGVCLLVIVTIVAGADDAPQRVRVRKPVTSPAGAPVTARGEIVDRTMPGALRNAKLPRLTLGEPTARAIGVTGGTERTAVIPGDLAKGPMRLVRVSKDGRATPVAGVTVEAGDENGGRDGRSVRILTMAKTAPGLYRLQSQNPRNQQWTFIEGMNVVLTSPPRAARGIGDSCTQDNPTSPGAKIVHVSGAFGDQEIYSMNADGGEPVKLTDMSQAATNTNDGAITVSQPSLSPDGTKVAFVKFRGVGNPPTSYMTIHVMNSVGGGMYRLSAENEALDRDPSWSPDGTRIVFASFRTGNYEIYMVNADGSALTRLTNTTASDTLPDMSPDGTRIAYCHSAPDGIHIYVMNADGSNNVDTGVKGGRPKWCPTGAKILFSRRLEDQNDEIYVMNPDGSGVIRLTNNPAHDGHANWSPKGTKIVFERYTISASVAADPDSGIFVMNTNGSGQTQILTSPQVDGGHATSPTW